MYVYPNTNIKIYSGIPLDNSYENTLWFDSLSEQNSYFHGSYSLIKHTLIEQSYQRVEHGKMRVAIPAESLYDCNYLAFQNRAFGYKWFYAFILGAEYVNNETTEITFEIDIMQTYLFDVSLGMCLVEREHSDSDEIGDNLVPENLELGEYMDIYEDNMSLDNYYILLLVAQEPTTNPLMPGTQAPLTIVGDTIQCAEYMVYTIDNNEFHGLPALQSKLTEYSTAGNPDAILGVFLIPQALIGEESPSFPYVTPDIHPIEFTKQIFKRTSGVFGNYTPKNNKLYTYPYNFLYVTNMCGNSAIYPYEYFSTPVCKFTWKGVATANTEIIMFPEEYKGVEGINKDEAMSLKGFPQCAYNIDAFKAWLAQNTGSIGATILATAIAGTALGGVGMFGASAGGWTEALSAIYSGTAKATLTAQKAFGVGSLIGATQMLGKVYDHAIQPTQTRGNDTSTILSALRMLDFQFFNKRIRGEFARIIDDYFTVYGYATHRVKIPNRCVRQHWTYTKTSGCIAVGGCPADDIKRIKQIYDKGITFWVNPNEVGNYSLSNNPL